MSHPKGFKIKKKAEPDQVIHLSGPTSLLNDNHSATAKKDTLPPVLHLPGSVPMDSSSGE